MSNQTPISTRWVTVDDAPTTDAGALDRLERFGGSKLLGEMIALFLATAPERISASRIGVEQGDPQAVELALHALKSSAAQLGAMRMQRLSADGERVARSGVLGGMAELVLELDREFTSVHRWLAERRDGRSA